MELIDPPSLQVISNYTVFASLEMSGIISIVFLLFLLMLSGFASGSESAFFSLGPTEKETLKNENSKNSKIVLQLLDRPKELLAVLLITNNFVNVAIIILSSTILDSFFTESLLGPTARFLIEVIGITFVILMIGEVIPKIYSTKNALTITRYAAQPINALKNLPPLSWLKTFLVQGTNVIQRRAKRKGIKITTDELEQALALTKEEHTSEDEHRILEGIIKFGNTEACQIMRSRMDIFAMDEEISFKEVIENILEAGYSRIPVYKTSVDNVIGILYIKDLLPHLSNGDNYEWTTLLRKPFFIPENKKIDDLLKEFQEMKMHMAVVVDEYGGASGIITLEDILEEIVGDITDEFDEDEIVFTKVDDSTFIFEGRTTLVDFYKVLEIDGREFETNKGDSETLGGFMVEKAGRILKNNEYILCDGIKLIVESSDKRRIKMIKAIVQEKSTTA